MSTPLFTDPIQPPLIPARTCTACGEQEGTIWARPQCTYEVSS